MPDPIHLFVYGTLRAEAAHPMGDLLRAHGRFVGLGTIRARLYIIDDPDEPGSGNAYPGALPSPDPRDRVEGELHRIDEPGVVLPAFDAYEACTPDWPEPHEFLCRVVDVTMTDGTRRRAVSYLYTWDVSRARHVPSGRFVTVSPGVR